MAHIEFINYPHGSSVVGRVLRPAFGAVTPLWPHQERGIAEAKDRIEHNLPCGKSFALTSPTGGGKTRIMVELTKWAVSTGRRVAIFSARKLLTEQLILVFEESGVKFGVRAAGFDEYLQFGASVQICSDKTVESRVYRRNAWALAPADLVLYDEAHMQKSGTACKIAADYAAMGANQIGFTATPIGISHLYSSLVVAGRNSELRKCGALVPCHVYGPTEFDTSKIGRTKTGEFSLADVRKSVWTPTIFASVYEWWKKLNPDARPTILFAPGVAESVWFCEQFAKEGVKAAHIDGNDVWLKGVRHKSSRQAREDAISGVKSGEIKIICNRFVLREGIDLPELWHCILATPIGSLLSYVQTVGRVLRAHPSLTDVVLQDHGGSWWRHGSPNTDRDWIADYFTDDRQLTSERLDDFAEGKKDQPITCPECHFVRAKGASCPNCGHVSSLRSRMVIQLDGKLEELSGDPVPKKKRSDKPAALRTWESMYHRMRKADKTFRQAAGFFCHLHGFWPSRTFPLMPKNKEDMHKKIQDVPREDLIPFNPDGHISQPNLFEETR